MARLTVRVSDAARRIAVVVAGAVMAAILLAHAGLLPLASWRGDEYGQFWHLRTIGVQSMYRAIFDLNARPLTEPLVYLFWLATELARAPLSGWVAGLTWALLLAGCLVPATRPPAAAPAGVPRSRIIGMRVLVALTLPVLYLVGHAVGEMFYWPIGSLTYVPMLAAVSAELFLIADARTERLPGLLLSTALLTLTAGTSQVGLVFAAGLSILLTGVALLRWRGKGGPLPVRRLILTALPALLALVLLAIFLGGRRLDWQELSPPTRTYLGHVGASLIGAVPATAREAISLNGLATSKGDILLGCLTRLILFAGVWTAWRTTPRPYGYSGLAMLCFALACLATNYVVVFATLYHFGGMCCERHVAIRLSLEYLAIAALAICAARLPGRRYSAGAELADAAQRAGGSAGGGAEFAGAVLLLACVLVGSKTRFPELAREYRNAAETWRTERATWASGTAPGPAMRFYLPPPSPVVEAATFPPGDYHLADKPVWYLAAIMSYFHKESMRATTEVPP